VIVRLLLSEEKERKKHETTNENENENNPRWERKETIETGYFLLCK